MKKYLHSFLETLSKNFRTFKDSFPRELRKVHSTSCHIKSFGGEKNSKKNYPNFFFKDGVKTLSMGMKTRPICQEERF